MAASGLSDDSCAGSGGVPFTPPDGDDVSPSTFSIWERRLLLSSLSSAPTTGTDESRAAHVLHQHAHPSIREDSVFVGDSGDTVAHRRPSRQCGGFLLGTRKGKEACRQFAVFSHMSGSPFIARNLLRKLLVARAAAHSCCARSSGQDMGVLRTSYLRSYLHVV